MGAHVGQGLEEFRCVYPFGCRDRGYKAIQGIYGYVWGYMRFREFRASKYYDSGLQWRCVGLQWRCVGFWREGSCEATVMRRYCRSVVYRVDRIRRS